MQSTRESRAVLLQAHPSYFVIETRGRKLLGQYGRAVRPQLVKWNQLHCKSSPA